MIDLERYAAEHSAPLRDDASAPFFEGAAQNQLLLPRCEACDLWLAPVRVACPICLAESLSWQPASGKGQIFTWTVIHNAPPGFGSEVPYLIAEVELVEGPHLESRILGMESDEIKVDQPVEVAFCHPSEGESYPIFLPVRATG